MVKAIRVHKTGGPEVLQLEDVTLPAPGPGQLLIRNRAIGLNFIDTYFRTGLYPAPQMPFTPGNESAGDVLAVGEDVAQADEPVPAVAVDHGNPGIGHEVHTGTPLPL